MKNIKCKLTYIANNVTDVEQGWDNSGRYIQRCIIGFSTQKSHTVDDQCTLPDIDQRYKQVKNKLVK